MDYLAGSQHAVSDTTAPGAVRIQLARMPQQEEARRSQDDWTGLTDAAARRKLQNRLSQRLYRKRRADPKRQALKPPAEPTADSPAPLAAGSERALFRKFRGLILAAASAAALDTENGARTSCGTQSAPSRAGITSLQEGFTKKTTARLSLSELGKLAERYEEMTRRDFMLGSPRVDQLLTLIQFNVLRALLSNTKSLGWGFEWLECAEPVSPWNGPHQNVDPICPSSLRPTAVQRRVRHHPWIDLWPIPEMRDNLLLADGLYDEDRLCNDLVEFVAGTNEQSGLIVWGEPWDPAAWEVSESFARDWAWSIEGCVDLLASTNHWRTKRGEEPLFL